MAVRISSIRLGGAAGAPPLHVVPGFGGQALTFAVLARHLASACSLHSFHVETDPRPDAAGDPDVLGQYVGTLRASGPGPYRLAGYCAGAYIACAIASALRDDERTGRVLAIVRTGEEAEAEVRRASELLPELAAAVGRLRLGTDGGFEPADRALLDALRLPDGLAPRHAVRIAEVMAAQSTAMDLRRHVPFRVPVTLVIGAPARGTALHLREHWRSILRQPPEARLLLGPLSDAWLRRPGVEELSAALIEELGGAGPGLHATPADGRDGGAGRCS